jgi:hypothetical protein
MYKTLWDAPDEITNSLGITLSINNVFSVFRKKK